MTNIQGRLSILQITDMHILAAPEDTLLGVNTHFYFQAILDLAFAENRHYDLILLTGDLAQDPCEGSYLQILNCLLPYKIPCICLPGNHDDLALMQQILNSEMVSCSKNRIFEHWQLICLNSQIPGSPGGRLAEQELQFLEQCLLDQPDLNALIAVHHHCLETKSAWMDTMMIENSEALFSIVNRYPQVKAITNGHIHQLMDVIKGSVRIMGTPSTCFQFEPESKEFGLDVAAPGYRSLTLYRDGRIESDITRLSGHIEGLEFNSQGY